MINSGIYPFPHHDSFEIDDQYSLYLHLKSRAFSISEQYYSAPFWDLINHNPNGYPFTLSPSYISAPSSNPSGISVKYYNVIPPLLVV